jgi:hypothetical protein
VERRAYLSGRDAASSFGRCTGLRFVGAAYNVADVRDSVIRVVGLCGAVLYAAVIAWVLLTQPSRVASVTGGLADSVGLYRVDPGAFEEGLRLFRADRFLESRLAFLRADPASRDATTQFYVAYSYYRQGWGRLYSDDELFGHALAALDRADAAAAGGRVAVEDRTLGLRTSDELRAELQRGLTRDASDVNPLRLFRSRQ